MTNYAMVHFNVGQKVHIRNHEDRYSNAVIKSQVDRDHYVVSCLDKTTKTYKSSKNFQQMPNFVERTFHIDDLYPFELTQSKLWGVLE